MSLPYRPLNRRQMLASAGLLVGGGIMGLSLAACGATGGTVTAVGTAAAASPSLGSASTSTSALASSSRQASPTAPASAAAAPNGAPVTLRLTSWLTQQTSQDVYQHQLIQPYQQATPGTALTLETIPFAGYGDKITAYNASGDAPDLLEVSVDWFPQWAKQGWLAKLDSLVDAAKINRADYNSTVMGSGRWPNGTGPTYSWWTMMGVGTFYYNKALFDAAGQAYPDGTWTWDQARAAAQRLTKPGQQWGLQLGYYQEGVIYSFGGQILDPAGDKCLLDQPGSANAHQFWADLFLKYKVSATGAEFKAAGVQGNIDPFAAGHVGMYLHGSYQIGPFRQSIKGFDWDVAIPPKGSAGSAAMIAGNPSHALAAAGKHQDRAWDFLRWWVSNQTPEQVVLPGNLPTRLVAANAWTKEQQQEAAPKDVALVADVAQKFGKPEPIGPHGSDWGKVWSKAQSAILSGQQPVAQALQAATAQIDAILAEP